RLPAALHDDEDLPTRRGQLFESAIDHGRIVERGGDAIEQFIDRPLIARLAQLVRNLPQKRFIVALEGVTCVLSPLVSRAQCYASIWILILCQPLIRC